MGDSGVRTGIQSVEVAAPLLRALSSASAPMPLSALASAAGMPRSQAHKYMTSLVRTGLAAQAGTGEPYTLGSFAIDCGLAAIRNLDVVTLAQDALDELRDRLNTTASLAIWGNHGPTIIRWAETPQLVSPAVRLGTVFPVLSSLFGLVFGTYLDARSTQDLIRTELAEQNGAARRAGLRTLKDVEDLFAGVRKTGFAAGHSIVAPGVAAITAPVFDHTGRITAVIAAAGLSGQLSISKTEIPARAVVESARKLSRRMGAPKSG